MENETTMTEQDLLIKRFYAEKDRLNDVIFDNARTITLKDILDMAWSLYHKCGVLNDLYFTSFFGIEAMKAELVEHYVIVCSTIGIVPKSGYGTDSKGEQSNAEEIEI